MPNAIQPHCVLLSELSPFAAVAAAAAPTAAAPAGVTPPLVVDVLVALAVGAVASVVAIV